MSISEKDLREYEEQYKKLFYDEIDKMIFQQTRTITEICRTGRYIAIDTDIPNIGITLSNKLNELVKEFRRTGGSMFVEVNKENDCIDSNFVGIAVIEDMISQVFKGALALEKYNSSMMEVISKRREKYKYYKSQDQ